MTGDKLAVIFKLVLPLNGGKGQVADLTGQTAEEAVKCQIEVVNLILAHRQNESVKQHKGNGRNKAANYTRKSFIGRQMRENLALSQKIAREISSAVA